MEVWRERVLPRLLKEMSNDGKKEIDNQIPSFLILLPVRMECVILNLLECVCYHLSPTQTASDTIVDLLGYLYRRLVHLVETPKKELSTMPPITPEQAANVSSSTSITDSIRDMHFSCSMSAIGITQCIVGHTKHLSVSVAATLTTVFDFPLVLVPVLETQPWWRRTNRGHLERFDNQQWKRIVNGAGGDSNHAEARMPTMALNKAEGQLLLALFGLVMQPELHNRYDMNGIRLDNFLKIRKYLTEPVKDQIPPLADLHRLLEEMAIAGAQSSVSSNSSISASNAKQSGAYMPTLLEIVPQIRESICKEFGGSNTDAWYRQALLALDRLKLASQDKEQWLALGAKMCSIPDILLSDEIPTCVVCSKSANSRCSGCQKEWYCSRDCQVDHWKASHKKTCPAAAKNKSAAAGGKKKSKSLLTDGDQLNLKVVEKSAFEKKLEEQQNVQEITETLHAEKPVKKTVILEELVMPSHDNMDLNMIN